MHTTKKSTPISSNPTDPAPVVRKTKRRVVTPSVVTPYLAAVAQDVTSPTPMVSVTPTVPSSGTASRAATPTPAQSIATGTLPVVTTPTTGTSPFTLTAPVPVAVAAPPNAVSPPPDVDIPSPPPGFMAPSWRDFLGYRPTSREIAAATTAIADLGSFDDYVEVVGSAVPMAACIVRALQLGVGWRGMRDSTATWDVYARAQDSMAWKNALTLLDKLKPVFLGAVAKNAALATKYAGLMQMFDAPKVVAELATATKKKNAKARAAAAAPAAQAAGVAAPAATAEAPATAGKTVTVNA